MIALYRPFDIFTDDARLRVPAIQRPVFVRVAIAREAVMDRCPCAQLRSHADSLGR